MISVITILLFFLYLFGIGYTTTYFLKKPEHWGERFLLYLAIGLGVFPILVVFLNFIYVPLDWKVIFLVSLVFPLYVFIRKIKTKQLRIPSFKFNLTKSDAILLGVLLIFSVSLFMYAKGAFSYPYLEDEDPWGHAVGAKYVALEKRAYDPVFVHQTKIDEVLSYIDPYPPAYDVLLGILHQTSPDLPWTLKFFNALIISLGLVFFYLFAQYFIGSKSKALLATFFLAAIPSYFSHFIWAHTLVVVIFFPAMYALLMIKEDKKWFYVAVLIIASIWVTQMMEQPIKLTTLLLLFLIVASLVGRRFLTLEFAAVGGGMLLSFIWWGVMLQRYTLRGFIRYFTGDNVFAATANSLDVAAESAAVGARTASGVYEKTVAILRMLTSAGGSNSRAYSFSDFFIARTDNLINAPIGIGMVLSTLVLFGLVYILWRYRSSIVEQSQMWLSVTLFWLIYTFWGVNGHTFLVSVAHGTFRVWLLLAIPVALLAAEGTFVLASFCKRWKVPTVLIMVFIIFGVIATSGYQKYTMNTSIWPTSGTFSSPAEPVEYAAWFNSVPLNTEVFLYSPRDKITIGLGGYSCFWCEEIINFRKEILYKNVSELYAFLNQQNYKYLVINPSMDSKYFKSQFGENKTAELLPRRYEEIQRSPSFTPVFYKENHFLVLKVN